MSLQEIIDEFDAAFEATKRPELPLTKEEWQTLKAAVLGTTTNNARAKPCTTCRNGDISECDDCLHRDTLIDNYRPRTASPVA
jgi:hypothetical protein